MRLKEKFRGGRGARWDEGERNVLCGLAEFGFRDAFRSVNGYGALDASWILKRKLKTVGRRFDHIFATEPLGVQRCRYLHEWREAGLSDHAAIEADLDYAVNGAPGGHPVAS